MRNESHGRVNCHTGIRDRDCTSSDVIEADCPNRGSNFPDQLGRRLPVCTLPPTFITDEMTMGCFSYHVKPLLIAVLPKDRRSAEVRANSIFKLEVVQRALLDQTGGTFIAGSFITAQYER